MATFDLLDPNSFAVPSRDPFSKSFNDDFGFSTLDDSKAGQQYQPMTKLDTKSGFQVNPLHMDPRRLGHSALETHPQAIEALRSRMPLSPPGSAEVSPKQWPFDEQDAFQDNSFVNPETATPSFSLFGQMTPPGDEGMTGSKSRIGNSKFDTAIVLPSNSADQHQADSDNQYDTQTKTKPKRNRKSTGRTAKRYSTETNDPNDMRRSKFLERNRVAASKCRQKKKEWTSNLESRARELQSENHNLHLWLDSLRDEYMYLKTQIAEHRTCESRAINSYLDDPKRDLLALSNPASRNLLESMRRHRIKQEPNDDDEKQQDEEDARVSGDDDALGALLADSISETRTG